MSPSNEEIDTLIKRLNVLSTSSSAYTKMAADLKKIKLISGENPQIPELDAQMSNQQRRKIFNDIRKKINSL